MGGGKIYSIRFYLLRECNFDINVVPKHAYLDSIRRQNDIQWLSGLCQTNTTICLQTELGKYILQFLCLRFRPTK